MEKTENKTCCACHKEVDPKEFLAEFELCGDCWIKARTVMRMKVPHLGMSEERRRLGVISRILHGERVTRVAPGVKAAIEALQA